MYSISRKRIQFECGIDIDQCAAELQKKVMWDPDEEIVWVKNFFKHQCQNSKFAKAAIDSIATMPDRYRLSFKERYVSLLKIYHIDTILIWYPAEQNRTETERERSSKEQAVKRPDIEPKKPTTNSPVKVDRDHLAEVVALCKSFNGSSPQFNPYQFTNRCVKRSVEPDVVIAVLTAIKPKAKAGGISDFWAYATSLLKVETSKWHQARQLSKAKAFAEAWSAFGESEQGKALLKTIKLPRAP
jgi:uncharacterized protein (UPF0248 family)